MNTSNPVLYLTKKIKLPLLLMIFAIIISIIGSAFQLLVPLFTQYLIDNFTEVIKNKLYLFIFASVFLLSAILNG